MREIKFRTWDTKKKIFHYGAELYGAFQPCFNDGEELEFVDFIINKDRFILQQFTDLKDKNGNEIYEGDVIRDVSSGKDKDTRRNSWEVAWRTNGYLLRRFSKPNKEDDDWATNDKDGYIYFDPEIFKGFEIIGNIYENPKLLKED